MRIHECDIEQVLIFAFRYAVNRHFTQAMYRGRKKGLGDVIVDNLPYIGKEPIRQMIDDIEQQQRIEQYDREENAKEYLDGWHKLRMHLEDYQRMLKDVPVRTDAEDDMYEIKARINELLKLTKDVPFPVGKYDGWRDMTSTAYLTPLLERLRDELAAREAVKLRGKQE